MSAGGLLSLKWNNHCSTFLHILSNLHKKQTYHDATVACGGLLYPVHKMVLSTCSEYFEEMFDSIHDKHPIIVLKDIKGEVFEALLKYMYIGEVNVIQDRLSDLISAAECLKIKGLAVPDEEPSDNKSSRHSRSSSSSAAKRRHEQMSDSGVTSLPPSKVQRSNSNNSYNNRNVNNVQSYASSNVMSRSQPVVDKSKPAECSREARDGSSYRSRKHSDDDIEEIQPEIKQEPRDVSAGEEEDMADDGTEQQTMRDGSSSHDNSERKHLSHQDRGGEPGRTEKSARNMSGGEEEELSKQEMVEEEDESNVSEHWGGNDGDEEGDTFGFLGGDSNSGAGGTDGDTTHHHQQDNEEDDNNDGDGATTPLLPNEDDDEEEEKTSAPPPPLQLISDDDCTIVSEDGSAGVSNTGAAHPRDDPSQSTPNQPRSWGTAHPDGKKPVAYNEPDGRNEIEQPLADMDAHDDVFEDDDSMEEQSLYLEDDYSNSHLELPLNQQQNTAESSKRQVKQAPRHQQQLTPQQRQQMQQLQQRARTQQQMMRQQQQQFQRQQQYNMQQRSQQLAYESNNMQAMRKKPAHPNSSDNYMATFHKNMNTPGPQQPGGGQQRGPPPVTIRSLGRVPATGGGAPSSSGGGEASVQSQGGVAAALSPAHSDDNYRDKIEKLPSGRFKCSYCTYEAGYASALKIHLRIHSGEKPYKCPYCSHSATTSGNLKTHLRKHTGETPYACHLCTYKAKHNISLRTHMATVHNVTTPRMGPGYAHALRQPQSSPSTSNSQSLPKVQQSSSSSQWPASSTPNVNRGGGGLNHPPSSSQPQHMDHQRPTQQRYPSTESRSEDSAIRQTLQAFGTLQSPCTSPGECAIGGTVRKSPSDATNPSPFSIQSLSESPASYGPSSPTQQGHGIIPSMNDRLAPHLHEGQQQERGAALMEGGYLHHHSAGVYDSGGAAAQYHPPEGAYGGEDLQRRGAMPEELEDFEAEDSKDHYGPED